MRDTLSLIDFLAKNYNKLQQLKREDAKSIITFVNALIKSRYNIKHYTLTINVNNKVYLRLH